MILATNNITSLCSNSRNSHRSCCSIIGSCSYSSAADSSLRQKHLQQQHQNQQPPSQLRSLQSQSRLRRSRLVAFVHQNHKMKPPQCGLIGFLVFFVWITIAGTVTPIVEAQNRTYSSVQCRLNHERTVYIQFSKELQQYILVNTKEPSSSPSNLDIHDDDMATDNGDSYNYNNYSSVLESGFQDKMDTINTEIDTFNDNPIFVVKACWCSQYFGRPAVYCPAQFDACRVDGEEGPITCFTDEQGTNFIRGFWFICLFWFVALLYAFFFSEQGSSARAYIKRKLCLNGFLCFQLCNVYYDNDNNNDTNNPDDPATATGAAATSTSNNNSNTGANHRRRLLRVRMTEEEQMSNDINRMIRNEPDRVAWLLRSAFLRQRTREQRQAIRGLRQQQRQQEIEQRQHQQQAQQPEQQEQQLEMQLQQQQLIQLQQLQQLQQHNINTNEIAITRTDFTASANINNNSNDDDDDDDDDDDSSDDSDTSALEEQIEQRQQQQQAITRTSMEIESPYVQPIQPLMSDRMFGLTRQQQEQTAINSGFSNLSPPSSSGGTTLILQLKVKRFVDESRKTKQQKTQQQQIHDEESHPPMDNVFIYPSNNDDENNNKNSDTNNHHSYFHDLLDDDDDEVSCAICLIPLEHDDYIGNIPCGHIFHKECLKSWLKRRNHCPLCQQSDLATLTRQQEQSQEQQSTNGLQPDSNTIRSNSNREAAAPNPFDTFFSTLRPLSLQNSSSSNNNNNTGDFRLSSF